jgi:alkanesulfonate monooxygenase SsuD/methylene tetrahydromethanopterin reductase-like flavin-dependent oxidoreductase (luciferase family)
VIGSPVVADVLRLVQDHACDGFNMIPPLYPNSLNDFVDLVVPSAARCSDALRR